MEPLLESEWDGPGGAGQSGRPDRPGPALVLSGVKNCPGRRSRSGRGSARSFWRLLGPRSIEEHRGVEASSEAIPPHTGRKSRTVPGGAGRGTTRGRTFRRSRTSSARSAIRQVAITSSALGGEGRRSADLSFFCVLLVRISELVRGWGVSERASRGKACQPTAAPPRPPGSIRAILDV